jgi:hypothetical protein
MPIQTTDRRCPEGILSLTFALTIVGSDRKLRRDDDFFQYPDGF